MKLSKGIDLLLIAALIMLLAFPVQGVAETNGWYASKDGTVEVRFISWEVGVYPEYKLKLQFRLDQSQESDELVYTVDIKTGDDVTSNGRRAKATSSGDFADFSQSTMDSMKYCLKIQYTIGKKQYYKDVNVDMTRVFPDDFFDKNAYYAAQCIKALETMLNDPSDYEFSDLKMYSSKAYSNEIYFVFALTAKNTMGGKTSQEIFANYNTSDGTVLVYFSKTKSTALYGD